MHVLVGTLFSLRQKSWQSKPDLQHCRAASASLMAKSSVFYKPNPLGLQLISRNQGPDRKGIQEYSGTWCLQWVGECQREWERLKIPTTFKIDHMYVVYMTVYWVLLVTLRNLFWEDKAYVWALLSKSLLVFKFVPKGILSLYINP